MARAGRPPKVTATTTGEFVTKVKGQQYQFRQGADGRLRALGNPERNEDFEYARQRVKSQLKP